MKTALRVGVIGSVVPKKCGIATFSRDLLEAMSLAVPDLQILAVAAEEPDETYEYTQPVIARLKTNDRATYRTAATALNKARPDVIILQHEFGLYGGGRAKFTKKDVAHDDPTGDYILDLLENLTAPIITILHTVLPHPDADRRQIIRHISRLSQRIVTMSETTKWILIRRYAIPASKIAVIPHGVPTFGHKSRLAARNALGLAPGNTYLTVTGLLGPNKGVDLIIRALPQILAKHPKVRLLVVGQTHPGVLATSGETYRDGLVKLAEQLEVHHSILFKNTYVATPELMDYLSASDAYLTVHRDPEQAASGTLAYAVGSGLPTISTPYVYAKELLACNRGMLVPFENPDAIARAVGQLVADQDLRQTIKRHLRSYRRSMSWPVVAKAYLRLLDKQVLQGEHAVL